MKNKLRYFFSFLAFTILLTSCDKEYSTEYGKTLAGTNSGTAVYIYTGTGTGNCLTPNIKGTYSAGAATTINNIVTLQVTVVTPGTFVISTATINGITFKGSGSFSTTGVQNVSLFASGTPVARGTFSYIAGSNGCAFNIVFTTGNVNTTSVFTFPEAPNACTLVTINGAYNAGAALTSANTIEGIHVNVTKIGTYYISTLPNNGITFTGSGTFTATGLQTITLNGGGTPVTSGAFTYSPGNNGCLFTITVLPAGPVLSDYIKCKIDGVSKTFAYNVSFTETNTAAQPPVPASNTVDITGSVSAVSNENMELSPIKTGTSISTADVFNPNSFTSGKAYLISYRDASLANWNAVSGVSFTPFNITVTSKTTTRIQGTFSGTLSDTGAAGGNTKIVTEGTFSVPVK
ncbi:hypothetical protein [Ferruginibacter sp.]|uniref:hypothetical protein n=1 Tax=Ferruginibacter sp. TaxID=1940288 RepID=UPI00265A8653|nr:hypothetical protein [Ferruginibacter sp.]